MLKLSVTTVSLLKAFCRFITSFPTKPSSATIFVGAINTLFLKLIICSVCTCTTGKSISVHLLGFTYFSVSRWGGVFFGVLVVILINVKDSVVFFQGKYKPQPVLFKESL